MWYGGNYRRIFLDMHIADWNDEFLSKLDPEEIITALKNCGAQHFTVKAKPVTGLCYWPSSVGRMHKGLKGRDYVGEMTELCHQNGIAVSLYFPQMYDSWAYENHPSWRCVTADGLTSMEYLDPNHSMFRSGRFGIVCASNPEYRQYVKANLQELTSRYRFESIFLDTPFYEEVCYCPSCREKYFRQTGREMPSVVDWNDPAWVEFQQAREEWIREITQFSTKCVKEIRPEVSIEHNFGVNLHGWKSGTTEAIIDASDYAVGDFFGGYLQQTFMCKYLRSITPNFPFAYLTSRCEPGLWCHTTTRTKEEFIQFGITALLHNGAFSIVDAMNPDGSICPEVYHDVIGPAFDVTREYEKYAGGDMMSNVSVWFSSRSKYCGKDNGKRVTENMAYEFIDGPLGLASILRENNVPFSVVSSKNLSSIEDEALVVSDVSYINDEEIQAIENYVLGGGNLLISGRFGHKRLCEMLEAECCGETEQDATYMSPTELGREYFEGFSARSPMMVAGRQQIVNLVGDCDVLATITLPYTMTGTHQFASVHSNPPGIHTEMPAILRKRAGKGSILWFAAPIEKSAPHMSRRVVCNLVKSLCGKLKFKSNAPANVEILGWRKDGRRYFAAVNQQESMPISPVYDVYIELPETLRETPRLAGSEASPALEYVGESTRIRLPRIDIFRIIELPAEKR